MKTFVVTIGRLWAGPEGAVEEHDFEKTLEFDPQEIIIKAPVSGHMLLAKPKREITVVLSDVETVVERTCEKCLSTFDYDLTIPAAERSFFAERPTDDPDFSDNFLINKKDLTIDIYDMVRQEIILHFPLISVCSKSCKGLCPRCGVNKNEKKCTCKEEDLTRSKPFKNLKKLMK